MMVVANEPKPVLTPYTTIQIDTFLIMRIERFQSTSFVIDDIIDN